MLFLTHRLPYAPNRGDRVRAYFLLRTLRPHADVDLVSLVHDEDEAGRGEMLTDLTASVRLARVTRARNLIKGAARLPGQRPMTHSLLDAPHLASIVDDAVAAHRPDVVLAYCSGMARLAMTRPLDAFPFVLDMVDVDSAKWAALGRQARPPLSWIYGREARTLGRFEAAATAAASATLVVTPREGETLAALAPGTNIHVVPNGVDVAALVSPDPPRDSETVVFCGVMNYTPNERAAELLARDVWPLVRRERPHARLQIVGAHPTVRVRALAGQDNGVEVTGAVPDVRPYLWSAAAAAAPIFTARGIQNKVLEAVAAGLPTVVTPNILDSLPEQVRPACISAATAPDLARAVIDLLGMTPHARRALADRADVSGLTWESQLGPVVDLLGAAARSPRPTRHAS